MKNNADFVAPANRESIVVFLHRSIACARIEQKQYFNFVSLFFLELLPSLRLSALPRK